MYELFFLSKNPSNSTLKIKEKRLPHLQQLFGLRHLQAEGIWWVELPKQLGLLELLQKSF